MLLAIGKFHPLDAGKEYGEKIRLLLSSSAWDFGFLAISGLTIWFVVRRPRTRLALLFLVLLADMLRLHWDHFYLFPADFYRKPPETVQVLEAATVPFWRVSHYLEYPGLEMWQMHNDPFSNFSLLEREKAALSFGIHAIFSYRHVGAHLPLIWNWEVGLTPAEKSTRYLFSNSELTLYRGDSLRLLKNIQGMNAYELINWKPRFEHLPSQSDSISVTCSQGFSGYQRLCVKEVKDGEMQIMGSFKAGDTLLVRERAYRGWRYRLDRGPWLLATPSSQHFLILPVAKHATMVELEFFPKDFYFLLGICGILSVFIPTSILVFRKRR